MLVQVSTDLIAYDRNRVAYDYMIDYKDTNKCLRSHLYFSTLMSMIHQIFHP